MVFADGVGVSMEGSTGQSPGHLADAWHQVPL